MPAKYGLGTEKKKSGLRWLYLPFMLLLGIGSLALATQRIAAFFNYHPALGEVWGVVWEIPWYAPWSVLAWQEQFGPGDTYGFIEQAITHSQALFLVPQFIVIAYWMAFMKKLKANANLHGSARWAEEKEIRTMGYFEGKGVYVGGWLKKYAGVALLARTLRGQGISAAAQAVGGAVGHNPISILIPCHRVVGSDGSLTGYAGGVANKQFLLELEGVDMTGLYVPTRGTAL